jgi:hypothetical protein
MTRYKRLTDSALSARLTKALNPFIRDGIRTSQQNVDRARRLIREYRARHGARRVVRTF